MYFVERIHPPFEWWWIPCSNLGVRNPFRKDPTVRNATMVTRFTGRQVASLCLHIVFWLRNHMNFGFKPILKDSFFQQKENTLNLRTPPPSSSLLWDCCFQAIWVLQDVLFIAFRKRIYNSPSPYLVSFIGYFPYFVGYFQSFLGKKIANLKTLPQPRSKFHLVQHHPNHPNHPASLGIRRNVLRNSTQ